MDKTKIEWCDATWNPVTGCLHGCEYCYARKIARRFGRRPGPNDKDYVSIYGDNKIYTVKEKSDNPYPCGFAPTLHEYKLEQPKRWKKPRTIFVCSMADLFGEWIPDEWIESVFNACKAAPQHRYLFLTKNPTRYINLAKNGKLPLHNKYLWYGSSVTDKGMLYFHSTKSVNTFISAEPLLSDFGEGYIGGKWIILGAETGNRKGKVVPKKEWIDNICRAANQVGVPVFMKDSLVPIVGEENMRREFPWEVAP